MMFSHQSFITSDTDLTSLLKRCNKCYQCIDEGKLIVSYNEIPSLLLNTNRKKICVIINTNRVDDHSDSVSGVGHWLLCCFDTQLKHALIYDSLNNLKKDHQNVLNTLTNYCKLHNFSFSIVQGVTQQKESLICGFIVAYFVHIFHSATPHKLIQLCKVFDKCNTENVEVHIMKSACTFFKT